MQAAQLRLIDQCLDFLILKVGADSPDNEKNLQRLIEMIKSFGTQDIQLDVRESRLSAGRRLFNMKRSFVINASMNRTTRDIASLEFNNNNGEFIIKKTCTSKEDILRKQYVYGDDIDVRGSIATFQTNKKAISRLIDISVYLSDLEHLASHSTQVAFATAP